MMKFTRRVFTGFVGGLGLMLGVALAVTAVVLIAAAVLSHRSAPRGILVIDLSSDLTDRGRAPSLRKLLVGESNFGLPLHRAIAAVRAAADDSAISGILLTGGVSGGISLLRELRAALAEFKAKGKPVQAWFAAYDDKTYYLASVADTLSIEPFGAVALDGFASQVLYYKDALDRFGVEVQVTRVGKYKSAVEPYLRSEMSPENREQLARLMGAMSDTAWSTFAEARRMEAMTFERCAEATPVLSAENALAARLIDRVIPFATLSDQLTTLAGESEDDGAATFRRVSLVEYAEAQKPATERGAVIGVVFAEGEIVDGESSSAVGGETCASELRALRSDPKVKAVVLRVNSPGGSATASEVIAHEVRRLKESGKVVVVSMADLAASGGYWIACEADAIVAHPTTITGSIGVFGMFPNAAKLLHELGVNREVVKASPHADLGSPMQQLDEPELAALQTTVDAVYDGFLERVARGRGKTRDAVHEIAQGRVWSGTDALELGLVDRLGSLDDAIALAAEKAKLGQDRSVRYVLPKPTLANRLVKSLSGDAQGQPAGIELAAGILSEFGPCAADLGRLARGGTFARLPYFVEVR